MGNSSARERDPNPIHWHYTRLVCGYCFETSFYYRCWSPSCTSGSLHTWTQTTKLACWTHRAYIAYRNLQIVDSIDVVDFCMLFLTVVPERRAVCSEVVVGTHIAWCIRSATHCAVNLASASWSQHSSIVCMRFSIPWLGERTVQKLGSHSLELNPPQ